MYRKDSLKRACPYSWVHIHQGHCPSETSPSLPLYQKLVIFWQCPYTSLNTDDWHCHCKRIFYFNGMPLCLSFKGNLALPL